MNEHAPGPWHVSKDGTHVWISVESARGEGTMIIATTTIEKGAEYRPIYDEWQKGNAQLIAAAPAMLVALERLIWTLKRESIEDAETSAQDVIAQLIAIRAGDAAIEAAKGKEAKS